MHALTKCKYANQAGHSNQHYAPPEEWRASPYADMWYEYGLETGDVIEIDEVIATHWENAWAWRG